MRLSVADSARLIMERELEIMADSEKLAQTMQNIQLNAWQYTPRGGRVRVALERAPRLIKTIVSNTGDPIPEEDLSLIFERFYRIDRARESETAPG